MNRNEDAALRHARRKAEREARLAAGEFEAPEKSEVADLPRGVYDLRNPFEYDVKVENGLTEDIIREISANKEEPSWMLEKRLEALDIFNASENPNWGPDLHAVDMNRISTYVRPKAQMARDWQNVPDEIRDTFTKLGIPEAELESLAGVGAQYDSEVVYHNMRSYLSEQGVIYTDFESAVHE